LVGKNVGRFPLKKKTWCVEIAYGFL
jgi:hypothetical protein